MATITELLQALNTKEAAVSTADLASALKSSKEGVLKQLTREKEKGNVSGNSQEGWLIADRGKGALEKGVIHPSMIDEGVTPRQQFEAKGRLIGISEDRIHLATDIVWSGDYNDVKWVWEALGQADIADDLRSVWVNSWRAKLHKGIPSELETELTGVSKAVAEAGESGAPSKPGSREFIIVEDEPVRVGENLGDYSLQDAKDILTIRALRNRFSGAGQAGGTSSPPGATEKVSELLTALEPYINKGSDQDMMKELITAQMELQKQEILSHIPQPGLPAHPKSFMEQVTEAVAALGSLKEVGPMLRSILGVPESSGNPGTAAVPVQLKGTDGEPIVMDLSKYIDLERFRGEERRADVKQDALVGLAKTVRENIPDGIQALLATVSEVKAGTGAKTPTPGPAPQPQVKCTCGVVINLPAGDWLEFQCPHCQQVWTREQVKEALGA